jgi:hypothetical protein
MDKRTTSEQSKIQAVRSVFLHSQRPILTPGLIPPECVPPSLPTGIIVPTGVVQLILDYFSDLSLLRWLIEVGSLYSQVQDRFEISLTPRKPGMLRLTVEFHDTLGLPRIALDVSCDLMYQFLLGDSSLPLFCESALRNALWTHIHGLTINGLAINGLTINGLTVDGLTLMDLR